MMYRYMVCGLYKNPSTLSYPERTPIFRWNIEFESTNAYLSLDNYYLLTQLGRYQAMLVKTRHIYKGQEATRKHNL